MTPPKIPDYIREADRVWGPQRFRMASCLWFKKTPLAAKLRHTGEPVTILDWRFAWFGIAFRLQFADGRVEHGFDPATVEIL
jgi:hypothetical protein